MNLPTIKLSQYAYWDEEQGLDEEYELDLEKEYDLDLSGEELISDLVGENKYAYDMHGVYTSVGYNLTKIEMVAESVLEWVEETPIGTSLTVETSVNGGATWQEAANGYPIPELPDDVTGVIFKWRVTLETDDEETTPTLKSLSFDVRGATRPGDLLGLFEQYDSLEWDRPYYTPGSFSMEINDNHDIARLLQKGLIAAPLNRDGAIDGVFLIEQLEGNTDEGGVESEVMSVSGRSIGGMFDERLALPPDDDSHDRQNAPAETAMKHYVRENAGNGATTSRQIPFLIIGTEQGRGDEVSYNARFQTLSDVLKEIGETSGVGWDVLLNQGEFEFDIVQGKDLSQEVFFDVEMDSALAQKWLTSDAERKTFAYVAGQGEGIDRQLVEHYLNDDEPTGFDRREVFVDARDTDNNLNERGESKLKETEEEDIFEVDVDQYGSFQYRRDWDIGDIVTIRSRKWGIQKAIRIVNVITTIEGNRRMWKVEVGRAWPSLKNRIKQMGDDAGKRV